MITIVKSIKVNHKLRSKYDEILSDGAKELLNQRILVGSWYPLEEYRQIYDSFCLIEGKNNLKTLHQWGIDEAKRWLTTIYRSTIIKEDLQIAVKKFSRFHRKVYNFGEIVPKFVSDTVLEFTYTNMPRDWENYYRIAAGFAVFFIETCLDKKVSHFFLNKSWIDGGWTKLKLSWAT